MVKVMKSPKEIMQTKIDPQESFLNGKKPTISNKTVFNQAVRWLKKNKHKYES